MSDVEKPLWFGNRTTVSESAETQDLPWFGDQIAQPVVTQTVQQVQSTNGYFPQGW